MIVCADTSIRMANEAFSQFGYVVLRRGREIANTQLKDVGMLFVRSVTRVDEGLLKDTPVKFVGTATIGTDHIDTGYLRREGIGFASAPGSNADSVAEYVVSALLAINKNSDFSGKTLGIVGFGNVGSRVCSRAQALGMRCLLNDPPKQESTGCDIFIKLPDLLQQADIVTVHVPLVTEGSYPTMHMIDERFLSMMKDGAILVNTSRGNVADEAAIINSRSRLGGCIIDVWQNEPQINEKLVSVADIATPHIAGYSIDGKLRGTKMIYDAACAFTFQEKKWGPKGYTKEENHYHIDLHDKEDPVFDAMQYVYPVMDDDGALREVMGKKPDQRGKLFDKIRETYPDRYECFNYSVHPGEQQRAEADVLAALGFSVSGS
ncbi:MAG: DUF3410 domain-containing protein [Chitinivibrionales bacterium]|nr:DUF3410 domain-containing protein [Chitinivibrionales bacterium]